MGDVVQDLATIGNWVRNAGYTGGIEVEIFNQEIWDTKGNVVLATVKDRCAELVLKQVARGSGDLRASPAVNVTH